MLNNDRIEELVSKGHIKKVADTGDSYRCWLADNGHIGWLADNGFAGWLYTMDYLVVDEKLRREDARLLGLLKKT